ncbi:BspA family leucine-rich repeat surface protein, partial [Clostridium sp. HCP1S3_A12]
KNIVLPDSIKNASNMFCDCSSLNANIYWPSSLENASDMFYNCTNMENFRDLINLTNLTNMEGMFRNCTSATFSNVTKCPINVTNLKAAFYGCIKLQLPAEFFSNLVATAINASWCFQNCSNLSNRIDIPTNITKVYFMFAYSGALETTRTVSN